MIRSSSPLVQLIGSKDGESAAFRDMPTRLAAAFRHFQVITGDAGLLCRESAALVCSLGKDYVLGLKGTQPTLSSFDFQVAGTGSDLSSVRRPYGLG